MERKTFPGGIGHVGIMLLDDGDIPEFTWTLWDGRHEGRGLMSEAAEAVKDHLMRDCGWDQIIARISPENRASRRMATRLGMVRDERAIAPAWYQGALTYHFEEAA